MTRTFIYTRKSTEHSQENSHGTQRAECESYATAQGITVTQIFEDTCSGSIAPYERPAFSEMLDQLKQGDLIITWKRDRLGRTVIENAVTERLLRQYGAELISLDAVQGDTPEAIMMRTLLDAFAEYEKAMISKRTRATLKAKRERGEVIGTPSLGTKANEKGHIVTDFEEQSKVERVRALRSEGHSFSALKAICEREGITARSGKTPSTQTLCNWCKGIVLKRSQIKSAAPRAPQLKNKPSVNEREPQLVYTIQDLRDKGLSLRAITAELNQRGYRTSRGGLMQMTQVRRILKRATEDAS